MNIDDLIKHFYMNDYNIEFSFRRSIYYYILKYAPKARCAFIIRLIKNKYIGYGIIGKEKMPIGKISEIVIHYGIN